MARAEGSAKLAFDSGLRRYVEEIRRYPLLDQDDELRLAQRWRQEGDRNAVERLVTSHLRLVVKLAVGYRGYGLPMSEVISEGSVGLMRAAERFEPERGVRFSTYAIWWIKASIHAYILRTKSLVRMGTTANQKRLFFKLRAAKGRISAIDDGDMRPEQVKHIAEGLGVTEQDVVDMNRRLGGDVSLNVPLTQDSDSGTWQDQLVDDRPSAELTLLSTQETANRRKALAQALTQLDGRERRILEARRLAEKPRHLEELAIEFRISPERVRQLEVRAFEKIRSAVRRGVAIATAPQMASAY
jgi:RNA polymerase sigma-32 factor